MAVNQGKLVILLMLGLSALMGGYAWWHNYQQGRRCLALWGAETAAMIRYGPRVEALALSGLADEARDKILTDDQTLTILAGRDITSMRGLIHARHALIEDASYDWDQPPPTEPALWTFALRFSDGPRRATLLFDAAGRRVHCVEEGRTGVLLPARMAAYQQRLPEWIGPRAGHQSSGKRTK